MLLLSASRVSWSAMAFCAGCGGEALDTRAATVRCTGFGDNLHGISAGSSFQQRKDVISSRRIYSGVYRFTLDRKNGSCYLEQSVGIPARGSCRQ